MEGRAPLWGDRNTFIYGLSTGKVWGMARPAAPDRPRRRLSAEARRGALVEAAYSLAESGGYDALTLEAVADRAGVTRNLLYHYFPDGRRGLYLAVLEHGIGLVASEWSTDEEVPLADRFEANAARFVDFAEQGSGVWTLLREAGVSRDPEVRALAEGFRSVADLEHLDQPSRHPRSATARPCGSSRLHRLRRGGARRVARRRAAARGDRRAALADPRRDDRRRA